MNRHLFSLHIMTFDLWPFKLLIQGIVGCTPTNVPLLEIPIVFMGYNPQESLENTINTMGTLLGVHPIVPW